MPTQNSDPAEPYEYKARVVDPSPEEVFRIGDGKISGYVSLFLGGLSVLAVLCFQYPSVLTTQELRAAYDADFLLLVLKYGMFTSVAFGLLTFCLGKQRRRGAIGVLLTALAFGLGGYSVETGPVEPSEWSFGLD
ncbi:MAG: hypothetical protein ACI9BW_004017, partial [Gammaproteobacteria bacterium]